MLAFSGEGTLSIKTGDFPIHQQRMLGVVVGFAGAEIFVLNYTTMTKVAHPHTHLHSHQKHTSIHTSIHTSRYTSMHTSLTPLRCPLRCPPR